MLPKSPQQRSLSPCFFLLIYLTSAALGQVTRPLPPIAPLIADDCLAFSTAFGRYTDSLADRLSTCVSGANQKGLRTNVAGGRCTVELFGDTKVVQACRLEWDNRDCAVLEGRREVAACFEKVQTRERMLSSKKHPTDAMKALDRAVDSVKLRSKSALKSSAIAKKAFDFSVPLIQGAQTDALAQLDAALATTAGQPLVNSTSKSDSPPLVSVPVLDRTAELVNRIVEHSFWDPHWGYSYVFTGEIEKSEAPWKDDVAKFFGQVLAYGPEIAANRGIYGELARRALETSRVQPVPPIDRPSRIFESIYDQERLGPTRIAWAVHSVGKLTFLSMKEQWVEFFKYSKHGDERFFLVGTDNGALALVQVSHGTDGHAGIFRIR